VEADRHERRDQRQQVDILPQRRDAFRNRNQPALKPDRVGDDECRQAEQRVGDDVEGHEEAVVAAKH
jgi:hypothetical protein